MGKKISIAVIRRLPRYYRHLSELSSMGITKISSTELSKKMGLTASQVRQDLNCFGGFGRQGYGYQVESLFAEIGAILGIDRDYRAILIGVGNLGSAISRYLSALSPFFSLVGLFDIEPKKTKVAGKEILGMNELEGFCKKEKPQIAVLTLPPEVAPEVADRLKKCGIKGIWNFSGGELKGDVPCENVHLADSLMILFYQIGGEK